MHRHSFEDIYTEFYDKIRRYVQRYVGEEAAEDVAQAVFIRVHDSLGEFEGRSSLGTWVYRIATNLALDTVRKQTAQEKKLDHIAGNSMLSVPAPGVGASSESAAEEREMRV